MALRTAKEARSLAEQYLAKLPVDPPMELTILDEHTIESDFGWVFFWNSKRYQETGEFQYALAGNAPLIVDRHDGSIHEIPPAYSVEEAVSNYQKSRAMAL